MGDEHQPNAILPAFLRDASEGTPSDGVLALGYESMGFIDDNEEWLRSATDIESRCPEQGVVDKLDHAANDGAEHICGQARDVEDGHWGVAADPRGE